MSRLAAVAPSPRQRLLDAADELFYAEGIDVVGIDRIIARAGVAKASLYSTFGNKDGLIRAYLEQRMSNQIANFQDAVAQEADPVERLLAIFTAQRRSRSWLDDRGCPFNRAISQAPDDSTARAVTRAYRAWFRDFVTTLVTETGATDVTSLANQILLIYDGTTHTATMDGAAAVGETARLTARAAVASALGDG